jgi:hypothetical protein
MMMMSNPFSWHSRLFCLDPLLFMHVVFQLLCIGSTKKSKMKLLV